MSEPQLERSVLEAKEREELFAIADALGTRPITRARKGDLVTAILRATGVEVGDEPAPARRTRARKAAAPVQDAPPAPDVPLAGLDAPAESASDQVPDDVAAGTAAVAAAGEGAVGMANAGEAGGGDAAGRAADPAASSPEVEGDASGNGGEAAAGADAAPVSPAATPTRPTSRQLSLDDQGSVRRPAGRPTTRSTGPVPSGPRTSPGGVDANGPFRRNPRGGAGSGNGNGASTTPHGGGPHGPGSAGGTSAASTSGGGASGDSAGTGSAGGGSGQGNSHGGSGNGNSTGGSGNGGGSPGAGGPGNAAAGGSPDGEQSGEGGDRGRFDGEGGNRRNRRRRGRDRSDRPDRELPGQGTPDAPFVGDPVAVAGYLDLRDEGYGFMRTQGYAASAADVYVSISQVRRFSLRKGDWLEGTARPAAATEKYPALLRIDTVSGATPEEARTRPRFEDLVPVSPDQVIPLAVGESAPLDLRVIDLLAPLGRGQRGLITGPPRSGKSVVLTDLVNALGSAHPDLELLVVVIDERPEEVTELRRAVAAEVIATTFDRPADDHIQVAELVAERAKRLVEMGKDVVVILDGLTRLARAYNLVPTGTGRVLPGGIDAGALHHPKRFFAAARNIEGGGSLTMLATALVETGSRTDEVIYEELNGTANMELRLDGQLAARRVFPAVDLRRSSTRQEERLLTEATLEQVRTLRRVIDPTSAEDTRLGVESFLERLAATKTNDVFLTETARNPGA
jgi:transcription termination factor Rho